MTLGMQIALLRKNHSITQEALAQRLGVTNQAVSKWESGQCCPDVALLPRLAEVFAVTIDELFGRPAPQPREKQGVDLPWEDDDTLRVVAFVGRRRVEEHPAAREITLIYKGALHDLDSAFAVNCGDVAGHVTAGGSVSCGDVEGYVLAGGNVHCGDVEGGARAGGNLQCGDVEGDVTAGGSVTCGDVEGWVRNG